MNGVVEADETYIGGRRRFRQRLATKPGERPKEIHRSTTTNKLVGIVQRGGKVYSRHVEKVTAENLTDVIRSVVAADSHLNHRYRRSAQ